MKQSWRKYLGARAPRYTSYPSALQFDSSVTGEDYGRRLEAISLYEPLSLYVHVPFCRQMCWYCGCNMRVENRYERVLTYIDALIGEIRLAGKHLRGRGRPLSVHFGGGTPNYLTAADIERILHGIELEIGLTDNARLSIELDPRLLNAGDVDRLAGMGFRRMSLGVQDFDPKVQEAINRVQSFDLIEGCVSEMRAAGVDDISFDILYGLPFQTEKSFTNTIGQVIALSPDRVSVFGYAHLPSALPRQKLINSADLPGEELRSGLVELADDMLMSAGYRRVGFDHYAKPDNALVHAMQRLRLRRSFQGFTDEPSETVLAFGASAISFAGGLYAQNEKDIRAYCGRVALGELPTVRGVVRTCREDTIARAIGDLLCRSESDMAPLFAVLSPGETNTVCAALEDFEEEGVIRWEGNRIILAPDAFPLARIVAMALDPYARAAPQLARAV